MKQDRLTPAGRGLGGGLLRSRVAKPDIEPLHDRSTESSVLEDRYLGAGAIGQRVLGEMAQVGGRASAVGRYVLHGTIEAAWGRGFVHFKLMGDLPVGSGALGEARLAARYLSKYVGKDLGGGEAGGLHRYEVAEGFQPRSVALDGITADEVLGIAESRTESACEHVWRSRETEEWAGPPAVWALWA